MGYFADPLQILQSQDMASQDNYSNQPLHPGQQEETRSYHSGPGAGRPGQQPLDSQSGASTEGFDTGSNRNVDGPYHDSRHHRPSSSWASNSQFSDVLSPPYAQRLQYSRNNLPPIRDVAHTFDHNYHSEAPPYSQNFAPPSLIQNALDTSSYPSERPPFYDTTQRYGQNCPQVNRPQPSAQMEYYRFPHPGAPYQTPTYAGLEYSSPSLGVHHPSSPTVCGDADSRNRRRRGNLPKEVTDILRVWFHEHLDHPYPTEEDKQAFASRTGLTINQVSRFGRQDDSARF